MSEVKFKRQYVIIGFKVGARLIIQSGTKEQLSEKPESLLLRIFLKTKMQQCSNSVSKVFY